MSAANGSNEPKKEGRFFKTSDRFLVGLIVVECLLWIADRFGWLGFSFIKGWPVLVAVKVVFLAVLMTLMCFVISARFRSHVRYGLRSLFLLTVAAAIPCGWLSIQMQRAREQHAAVTTVLDAGGGVNYRGGKGPEALRGSLGEDFFSDVDRVEAAPSSELFGSGVTSPKKNSADPPKEFNDDTLMQITKGLTNLKTLDLAKAKIGDAALKEIGRFEALENLNLHETQVTDAGLVHLKSLNVLRKLWLSSTQIDGSGLAHLRELPKLNSIILGGTAVDDEALDQLRHFENLEALILDDTQITDAGLKHLSQLLKLRILSLSRTKITDAGLQHLAGLTELESLNLRYTNVSGLGMRALQNMTKLEMLLLDVTRVDDAGVEHLRGLKKLKNLFMDGTQVTDVCLPYLEELMSLETLILPPNRISEAGIAHLREALPKCRVNSDGT